MSELSGMRVSVERAGGCVVIKRTRPPILEDRVTILAADITRMHFQIRATDCIFSIFTKDNYEWSVSATPDPSGPTHESEYNSDVEMIKVLSLSVEALYSEIMSSTNVKAKQ